ncbi:nitrogen fixation protein NifZ [Limisalsivibrio acetivorans]|uniref:nitrogen fixation protein NifZ n=1 Tax=Limisalsivibrio acetivorans TaxID=1304888 RepID=UPI0003B6ACE3|nr:nitrogen fixation protein NifZ [Limisalsivibrio acetivorans]
MIFKQNQKVRVKKLIRSDGTCAGCSRGSKVAEIGDSGFVREITEFMFKPVIVIHFMESGKILGFREQELEIVEDFNPDTGEWTKLDEPLSVPDDGCVEASCGGSCQ